MEIKQFERYSDTEIIERIIAGETKLYEILIRRYNPFLYKIGRGYGYAHQDTEDLMQESYISAFYSLSKFENRSAFKTWLTRIMLNHCFQKKQKFSFQKEIVTDKQTEISTAMFHQSTDSEKSLINKELGHLLETALEKIPEDYRLVFTLRELNGLSISETVEALNITESNVKVRLNRAKKMLRTEIETMYSPEEIYEFNLVYCDRIVEKVMSQISLCEKQATADLQSE
jgi:RNA polymerase sigma factor (sigma-70 family)